MNTIAELSLSDLKRIIHQTIEEMLQLPSVELASLGWSPDKLVLMRDQLVALTDDWDSPSAKINTSSIAELSLDDLKRIIRQTIEDMLMLSSDELAKSGWSYDKLALMLNQLVVLADDWDNSAKDGYEA